MDVSACARTILSEPKFLGCTVTRFSYPWFSAARARAPLKVWSVSNFVQQHTTTCNRVCKLTQHVTSNSVVELIITCLKSCMTSLRSTPGWAGTLNTSVCFCVSTSIVSLYSSPDSVTWILKSTACVRQARIKMSVPQFRWTRLKNSQFNL